MKRGPAGDFSDPSGDLLVIALSLCIGKKSFLVFPTVCLESSFALSQADKSELASQTRLRKDEANDRNRTNTLAPIELSASFDSALGSRLRRAK